MRRKHSDTLALGMVCCSSLIKTISGGFVSWASDRPVGVCSMSAADQSFQVCGDTPINKSRSGGLQTRLLLCYSKNMWQLLSLPFSCKYFENYLTLRKVLLQENDENYGGLLNITGRDFRTGSCQPIMHVASQFRQLRVSLGLILLNFYFD